MTTQSCDLTTNERAQLLSGRDFWHTRGIEHANVRPVFLADGPHGIRTQSGGDDALGIQGSTPATCFPPAVAVGSSWEPAVAERVGAAIGREGRAMGVHLVLGPGINVKRSPLCGRNFEYFSEDPLLTGVLGAAYVGGLQGEGVGASLKHFAANNQETDRMRISADVDERTLREIYLPAFELVVTRARPATVMCSYNRINGVYASENHWLLTNVLREEWGFTGAVVSDWGAVDDPVAAVRAGLDLEMPGAGDTSADLLLAAVRAGRLDQHTVDRAAQRVLALTDLTDIERTGDVDHDAHHALAREAATRCAVLLKNDGDVLPLNPQHRTAVIGEFARTPRFQGGGSSRVEATRVDTPLDAIRAVMSGRGEVIFEPGFAADDNEDTAAARSAAIRTARSCDVAVIFAGLTEADESEGFDRSSLDLPSAQVDLIRGVADIAPRTIVVLSHGGVVALDDWHDEVDAILDGFLLGQACGSALADLLFGVVGPSGRLAESIPVRLADTASSVNFPGEQGHVRYGEGVMVGYRWHESNGPAALYPFGFGLSYTEFATSDLTVDAVSDDEVTVTVTVTNTGDRAGSDVVQIYVATTCGPVRRPTRELRAFRKIDVEPGCTRTEAFRLDRRAFAYWDIERHEWVVPSGTYMVQVCRDAATVIDEQPVHLPGDPVSRSLTTDSTVNDFLTHPVVGPLLTAALSSDSAPAVSPALLDMIASMPMTRLSKLLGSALPPSTLDRLVQLSDERVPTRPSVVDETAPAETTGGRR